MKRVGVITIFDRNGNFGNKLQNYAVVKTYEKLGLECETIVLEKRITIVEILKSYFHCFLRFLYNRKPIVHQYSLKRLKNYARFDGYLNLNYDYIKGKNISNSFDYFSVGSDQVWNPNFYSYDIKRKDTYFLTFTDSNKKICFSPSFGIDKIPKEWEEWFAQQLRTFRYLSVREHSGANIIKELIGRNASALIDPTLMLKADEWEKISKKPEKVDCSKPYLLTYFLGDCELLEQHNIEKISRNYGMRVYNLLNVYQPLLYTIGPEEFLYLISHASFIATDSFHACVFSFLFNKPFIVYDRKEKNNNMNSRILNFLSTFKLNRKYVNSGLDNDIWEHDYSEGYKQLEIERKKAIDFLKKALEA